MGFGRASANWKCQGRSENHKLHATLKLKGAKHDNGIQTPRTDDPVYDNYYKQMETLNDKPQGLLLQRITAFGPK